MSSIVVPLSNRARSHPDAPAISAAGVTLTFGQFGDRVARLAGGLRASGDLAAGARIVLVMENRAEFLELLFACWQAGLCAVPVNAKLHPREVAHIVGDSGARRVFTSESLEPGLRDALRDTPGAPVPEVVGTAAYARLCSAAPVDAAACASDDTAWLFYTSGTTGRPKGAMLSHRNLMFMCLAYYADIERVAAGHTMLHAAPLSHGSGLYGLAHLFGGGHQVIQPGFDPPDVLDALARYPAVSMFAAPTMVTRLLHAAPDTTDWRNLRTICYGGGPMYVSDLLHAIDRLGPRLYQLYGQGESPMTITGLAHDEHEGDRGERHLAVLGSTGTARTGVEVRIVGEDGRPLPAGRPGEVITRSDCVMSGYWNNPQATAAALRDGWLWTGDVGFIDERGYLTLRDRSKDLIISGGTNIYPREVEEALLQHDGVLECSVIGRPHSDWGEEVVAFVVVRPGAQAAPADLDAHCLARIARFKRPRHYRFVDALPKNNYGKVLKTALRERMAEEPGRDG